jgi:hypothetical protein
MRRLRITCEIVHPKIRKSRLTPIPAMWNPRNRQADRTSKTLSSARLVAFPQRPIATRLQVKEDVGRIPVNRTPLLVTSIMGVGCHIDADHSFTVYRTHGQSVGQDKAPLRSRTYVEECARR